MENLIKMMYVKIQYKKQNKKEKERNLQRKEKKNADNQMKDKKTERK